MLLGRITGWFGVRGELKARVADGDALRADLEVGLRTHEGRLLLDTITRVRPHRDGFVLRLAGVTSLEGARPLLGAQILVERSDLPKLPQGSYRAMDLAGYEVVDNRLGALGAVRGVRRYPSCDMLVVGPKFMLVPLLSAYDVQVDSRVHTVRVTLPDGFGDL